MRNLPWKDRGNKIGGFKLIHRFLIVLLGIFMTFIFIEIVLRIGSVTVRNLRRGRIELNKGTRNILCVGDSFTYGTGASADESYPMYLQQILDGVFGNGHIRIHNRGLPGQNSSQVRNKLLSQLKATNAEVLIILVGHNNYWSFNDLHLEGIDPCLIMKIEQVLGHLKVYRLLKISVANLSDKIARSRKVDDDILSSYFEFQDSQQRMAKFQDEIREYERYLSGHPKDIYSYLKLAMIYEQMGEVDRARLLVAGAYGIDKVESQRILKQQREIERFHIDKNQIGKSQLPYQEREKSFKRLFQVILKRTEIPHTRAEFKRYLDFQQEIVEEVLRRDLEWMVKTARQRSVKVIISSYPIKKRANRIVREMSVRLKVPFVDQELTLQVLVGETSYSDYFALDGHCTRTGYRKMAENIAEVLVKLL